MRWAGHAERMGEKCIQDFDGETRRKNLLEDPGADGRIIRKWIFKKWDGGNGLD